MGSRWRSSRPGRWRRSSRCTSGMSAAACSARRCVASAFILPSFLMVWAHLGRVRPLRRAAVDAGAVLRHRRGGHRDHRAVRHKLTTLTLGASAAAVDDLRRDGADHGVDGARDRVAVRARRARDRWRRRAWRARGRSTRRCARTAHRALARRPRPRSSCAPTLSNIFWFFTKAGAFVFGSGLAIVPFLYGELVQSTAG